MARKKTKKTPHWQTSPNTFLAAIIQAAGRHGSDSDPDMEVGDLQDLVWELWHAMPLECRIELQSSEKWNSFIALWGCEFRAPDRYERAASRAITEVSP